MKGESEPDTRESVLNSAYPGYPTRRLTVHDLAVDDLTLPDGEWSTGVHIYPSVEQQQNLSAQGYELDGYGRPLHPWLRDMLADPRVGVVTGLGDYWHWGPNRTADPIVMTNDTVPKILLIKRSDTGMWALPGGYLDGDEESMAAARRELFEEAGLIVTDPNGQTVYNGIVADPRTTAHAWPETVAAAWRVEGIPPIRPHDDADEAKWFAADELPAELHGSHALLIQLAIESLTEGPLTHAISAPPGAESLVPVGGGHMLYHRFIVATSDGPDIFMKSHDKHAFTDPERESHSRQYLHKEKHLYDHVRQQGFTAIPASVDMQDDHTLMLEALKTDEGWYWRAPENEVDQYVTDTLSRLSQLQAIEPPADFLDTLLATYDTHVAEGWQNIDDTKIAAFATKLEEWQPHLRAEFQNLGGDLVARLGDLRCEFDALPDPQERYLCHHDLRQANIAWHPDHGTKIIDWSWAGVGRKNSDATTLLIDLYKSGHDVARHMDHFNPDHALTLIGFWTAHSLWPSRDGDSLVRFHQAVSAISAYGLLMKYRQR